MKFLFGRSQDNLLLFNHARLSSMEDGHSNSGSKDYLVSLMFSHYDLNNNGMLETEELKKVRSSSVIRCHRLLVP
jgi:follistatin-related protein 5